MRCTGSDGPEKPGLSLPSPEWGQRQTRHTQGNEVLVSLVHGARIARPRAGRLLALWVVACLGCSKLGQQGAHRSAPAARAPSSQPSRAGLATGSVAAPASGARARPHPRVFAPSSPTPAGSQAVAGAGPIDYVLLVSVDGLAPRFIDRLLGAGELGTFRQLQRTGSWTHNARSDPSYTVTLPNHTTMLTGRPVSAVPGLLPTTHHGFSGNVEPRGASTLHDSGNPALGYVPSLFDVAHDHGRKTCLFSGKEKFALFDRSYDAAHGGADRVGADNGRDKIDVALMTQGDTPRLIAAIADEFRRAPCQLTFLHIADTDYVGHAQGWGSPKWLYTLRQVDRWLGTLFDVFESTPRVRGRWALVVTADHGGADKGHGDASDPRDYVVPFYLVAPGVPGGTDLYSLVAPRRTDPGARQPSYAEPAQPIRNGDAANLALELLGLPDVPGSLMRDLGLASPSHAGRAGNATR
jgi:hypothetical protein